MPTLTPQKISGLVVTPTVEQTGGIGSVSVAVDVGQSRSGSPPFDVVTREDLIVELFGPGGSFEAIASPDPGPLPVRVLRVAQARGEWTFDSGAGPATNVRVRFRGGTGTFQLADTFPQAQGFSTVPQVGDAFPIAPGIGALTPSILHRLVSIPRRLPELLKPPRRKVRCRAKRFEAPLNRSKDAAARSELFEVEADFSSMPRPRGCRCCEYRQFVRGTFNDAAGGPVRFDMPSGPLDPGAFREDGSVDEFGTGVHGFYGHRDHSTPGDAYNGAGAANGCEYRGDETPRCPPTENLHAEYLGLVVDVCSKKVVAVKTWAVDL
jgi:hypothetical protein